MILMSADCSCWLGELWVPVLAYDLTPGCPLGQVEDFVELLLVCGELGGHAAGFGAAAGGGVDEDGFADAGELGEQPADGHGQSRPGGVAAHEVRDLRGQDAGADG